MTALTAADVLLKTSLNTQTVGSQSANTVAGTFLGKFITTSTVSSTALNNIFPDITGAENAANVVDYQCIFVLNNGGGNSMLNTVIWVPSSLDVAGGATVAIALDPSGILPKTTSTQASSIANKNTAPTIAGSWVSPTATSSGGLVVGTVPQNNAFAVWIRRTITGGPVSPVNNDGATLEIDFDTTA